MNRVSFLRRTGLALALIAVAGCSTLPSSGPTGTQISAAQRRDADFSIIELDEAALAGLAGTPVTPTGAGHWSQVARPDLIGPGDVLQISVYEIGASLFGGQAGAWAAAGGFRPPTGSAEVLGPLVVDLDGAIDLPWAGRLVAAGKTPRQLAEEITAALQGKSQDPQVMVTVRENVANTAVVMGDVKKPGRIPLTLAGERLLDAVAWAGGPANAPEDSVVELTRNGETITARLSAIAAGSTLDVPLAAQDRVSLLFRPRSYTVFGAAGKVAEAPFQTPRLTLAEAIARAGGPSAMQADATAVFVFRYDATNLDGTPAPGARPVAYRLNLMQPQSYFLAQRFEMRSGDVVYMANARSNQSIKLIDVFNKFFSPVYTVQPLVQ